MNDDAIKRIQLNFSKLVNDIVIDRGLGDHLYQMGVINDEELELCLSRYDQTTKGQVRKLLKFIRNKREPLDVFVKLCVALRECEYDYLADDLENCDISNEVILDVVDAPEQKKTSLLDQMATQSQLLISIRNEHLVKIAKLEKENSLLKNERSNTLHAVQEIGFKDEGFINMVMMSANKNSVIGNESDLAQRRQLPDIRQLAATWELLTACRLSVDVVHYVAAVFAKRQPPEPFSNTAVMLREIVDSILANTAYVQVFEKSLQSLDICEIKGYGTLTVIADELFATGCWNWGRVVTWYAFCAYLACGFRESNSPEEFDVFGTYIWHLLDERYCKEISDAGGWNAFLKYVERRSSHSVSSFGSFLLHLLQQLLRI